MGREWVCELWAKRGSITSLRAGGGKSDGGAERRRRKDEGMREGGEGFG